MTELKRYFVDRARAAGRAGRGDSKRRAPEHYKKMALILAEKRAKKKAESQKFAGE